MRRDEVIRLLVEENAKAILEAREAERAYQDALERADALARIKALLDEATLSQYVSASSSEAVEYAEAHT